MQVQGTSSSPTQQFRSISHVCKCKERQHSPTPPHVKWDPMVLRVKNLRFVSTFYGPQAQTCIAWLEQVHHLQTASHCRIGAIRLLPDTTFMTDVLADVDVCCFELRLRYASLLQTLALNVGPPFLASSLQKHDPQISTAHNWRCKQQVF